MGTQQVSTTVPGVDDHIQVPLRALDRRVINRGSSSIQQVLIQWSNGDEAVSTWEDEKALRARFPDAPAWGQAGFQQRGNVSSAPVTANECSGEGEEQLASEVEAK